MNGQSTDNAPAQQSMASAPATKMTSVPQSWVCAFVLVLITLLAYQPVWHAGFIWDDDRYVTENQALRSLDGLQGIWSKPGTTIQYYPLVFTSFWVEYHLWRLQPLGYHLVNVLLHALNAVLLWRVLRRLEIPGAWWAAAIFALHPVTVESVAWITERKNVLSGLFYFLAVLAYLRFRPLTDREAARAPDWRLYWLALALFVCALFGKTVTCSLPAVILLLIWWKNGRVERRDVLALAPLFVLGVASGLMTAWMEKRAGASGAEWALSFVQRCLLAGRALWFYTGKLFWPHNLTFIYPRWEIDARVAWQYLFPLAALVVLIALWRLRTRIGRGPLVAVLCFAGTLAPALGFFDVFPFRYSFVADHFQYLACIGLISLAVSTGTAICKRAGPQGRNLGTVVVAIVLLILGVSTWRQARIYQDLKTLWCDTLAKNPAAWMAHNNLGNLFNRLGRLPDAIGEYEQALRLKPDYAEAHYNLGIALEQAGRLQDALKHYEQAVRIEPDYADAHNNLGITLARLGRLPEAIGHFDQALRLKPDSAQMHNNLGGVLRQAGKLEEAIEQYRQALRINPDLAEAHYNLGVALEQDGRLQDALEHYEQALRIKPDYAKAQYNLGVALVRLGRLQEAMGHWEQALRSKPDDAETENNLAWLLVTLAPAYGGDPVRAVTLAERACEFTNNRAAEYLDTLAVAYAAAGRFNDAVAAAQKAIGLARSAGQTRMANDIETRLELYRAGRAYRAPVSVTSPRGP